MTYHRKYLSSSVLAISAFGVLLLINPAQGLAVPILSPTLESYAVLGADAPGVSCVATCVIGGNVGSFPTGASAGSTASDFSFSFGSFQPAATATEGMAQADLTTAIGLANAGSFTLIDGGDLDAFQVGLGGSIAPGNYYSTAIGNLVGDLILAGGADPNPVWKFKFDSSLVTGTASNVFVTGTSLANAGIYWTTVSTATLNGPTFAGNVMAGTGISSDGNLTMTCGRLLTDTGPVTLIMDKISNGCVGGIGSGSGGFDQGGSGGNGGNGNVPEPTTLLLLGSGLAGLAAWRRKKSA